MKKMIGFVMLAIFLGGMFPANAASGIDPVKPGPIFKIKFCFELYIGLRHTYPVCPGFGICSIHLWLGPQKNQGLEINQVFGEAYFEDDGHFVMEFRKSTLRNDTKEKYLNKTFLVEEDYELPRDILDAAQYKGSYTIKANKYNIEEEGDILRVKF
jgi:hypothetical protein